MFITGVIFPGPSSANSLMYDLLDNIDMKKYIEELQNIPIMIYLYRRYVIGRVVRAYIDNYGNICVLGKIEPEFISMAQKFELISISYKCKYDGFNNNNMKLSNFACTLAKKANNIFDGGRWTDVTKKIKFAQNRF